MTTTSKNKNPHQRILETAVELFHKQGYRTTGINQIIRESQVAKATFYNHFPSKEALGIAYLREQRKLGECLENKVIEAETDPFRRLLSFFDFAGELTTKSDFRGCPFMNIAAEIPDQESQLRKEVFLEKQRALEKVRKLVNALKKSSDRYSGIDVKFISNAIFILMEGAISASQVLRDKWPIYAAKETAGNLILKGRE
ncbi:MAG: TetR/AcrR family transcriptional regulator [Spirochaetes bacterium]|nr:TetR/AcrR family transcriptional regulator [Spirochaetota bacterium]